MNDHGAYKGSDGSVIRQSKWYMDPTQTNGPCIILKAADPKKIAAYRESIKHTKERNNDVIRKREQLANY